EPTNDLDLETLELLEAELVSWPDTLLLVSHDRAFLDNVVTSTLVFEGQGHVQEFVGGYQDWVRQRAVEPATGPKPARESASGAPPVRADPDGEMPAQPRKLSYKERRELDELPGLIEKLEAEQRSIEAAIAGPTFYREAPATIAATLERAAA